MNRARVGLAATLVAVSFAGGTAFAQAPPMTSVLAGKKLTPPVKGQALVDYTKPNVKKEKEAIISTFFVKNTSEQPIARLTVDDTWYDDKGTVVTGGRGVILGLLQPGEVKEIQIETTFNSKMKTNNWQFSHANGPVKPTQVDMMDGLPDDAMIGGKTVKALKAAAAKAPAKK